MKNAENYKEKLLPEDGSVSQMYPIRIIVFFLHTGSTFFVS